MHFSYLCMDLLNIFDSCGDLLGMGLKTFSATSDALIKDGTFWFWEIGLQEYVDQDCRWLMAREGGIGDDVWSACIRLRYCIGIDDLRTNL